LSNITAGNYQVTISDASGCTLVRNFTITEPLALLVGENVQDVSCFGVSDGFIDLSISGGIAPYSYSWSNGATTQDLFNISGGNYSVDITDGNGCVTTKNYIIAEPASALGVTGTVTDENCFGDSQGAISLTVTGGTAPYSYSWNHGPTTKDVAGLGRGAYQVTVTDNSGCSVTTNYTVSGPDALQLSAVPTQIDCNGAANGELDVTVLGGTAPYTYSWSNGASVEDIDNLAPGNYSLTVTDDNGCTISGSWTITQPLAILIGQTTTDVSCFGASDGAIDVTVSGGISPYTYSWSNGATTQDLNGISGGNYTLTVIDANGCVSSGIYTVVEPSAALTVNGSVSDEICFGDNQGAVSLTVAGGTAPYTYSWNNGATTKDIAGLGTGTYQVTVTDANGCFVQTNFTVGGPAALTATSSLTNVSCNGATDGAIDITPTGGTAPYLFSWSNGATTEDITGLAPGNYSVTITDDNGCAINRNYTITQPTAIGITSSKADVTCFGAGDGSISVSVIGGTLPYTYSWSNGQTTKNLSGLSGGSYTLTVTDGNACTSTLTVVVDEPTNPLAATGIVTDETCFGDSQGAIDLTVSGGTAPYSYSWNHGPSGQDVTGLARGTYQVTVTDANGCSVVESFVVSGPDALQLSAIATQVDCNGAANGELDVTVLGGTAPYSYSWSNGSTSEDLTGLTPNNYNLTVTDANGCTVSGSWTITQPLAISVGENITDVACFGEGNGAIDLTVSGGVGGYTYLWSTGATTQDISGLSGGNYSVTITDANSCVSVYNYTVNEPTAALSVSGSVSDELCFGDSQGAITLTVGGGTGPYTYLWDHGPTSKDVSNLARGNYEVVVTDANGCSETANFTVGGPTALQVSAVTTQINCNGAANGAIDVTVTGGTGPYTYLWNNGATTEDISGLSPGNRSVTVTDANGCAVSGSWTITQPLVVTVSRTITDVTCFGASDGAIDLSVSGGITPYSYSWSNGATTQDISGLSGGTYSVTITDGNGCTSLKTYVVSEPSAALSISGTVTDENCYGDNQGAISLNVTGGTAPYSYRWNQGSITKDISALGQGVYQVTVTDANGCFVQSDFTVSGPAALSATGSTTQVSCNGAADGAIDIEVVGGTSPYTFAWGHGETSEDLSGLSPGNYAVVITDANGCSISRNYSITQPNVLGITHTVTDVDCFGANNGAISVNVVGGTLPYTYSWSNGATSRNISSLAGGSYDITVTDGNGCSLVQTIVVEEPAAALSLNANVTDELCFGDNQGAIDLTVTGGSAPYTFQWNNGSSSEDIFGLESGSYLVTVTDKNGCSISETYTLSSPNMLSVSGAVSPISCNSADDGTLDITVTGGTGPYTYSWNHGETTEDLTNLSPGTYVLTVTDANGCIAAGNWTLTEPLPLTINHVKEDVTCFGADDGYINLTVSGGTLPYTYAWSNGATGKDLTGLAGGTYEVTITDARGCQQVKQIVVNAPTAALSASPTIVDALCNGLPTGEVQLAVAGGTTPYSYQWSNGSNQRDLKNVFAGNYAVTITDAKGCSIVENYTVGEPDELDVTFDVTNTSCQGDSDGAIAVTTTGGTAPYNYVWSNGSTSKDLSNIAGGTYNLTITDANGCSITRSVEVDDSKDLSVEVQKADVLCKGESTGQIYLNIAGGTGVYDISWSNGSTSAVLENLPAGVYSATVADANNCSTFVTVVISEPSEELSLTLSDYKDLLCYGDDSGFMRANPQGGVAPYTYLWSNGARTSQISNLKAGAYTVTVTDANGCIVQSQATINQPDKPITISSQGKLNLSCKGDNDGRIVVDVEGGTGLYEFVWSTGARTSSIENLSVGDYTLRVTDANGCVQERVFTINEPEELTIEDALVNESQCYDDRNGSIELDISGGVEPYSYQWSTGATSKNLIGITSGDYSVLITDANGCQIQANYTLDEPALFRMEPTMTDISCIGANDASISLNIEGGIEPVAIRWSTGESSETISELGPGEYNVLVTDDKGCTIQQTFNVIEPLDLTLDAYIEDATRCNDPRSGRVNVIVSGGTEPYTYRWSNGATTSEITDVLPGTYVVRVRDRYNCEVQGTYTVLQPEPLQIGLSTEPYIDCENRIAGMLVKANVKGGVGNYRYEWSKGNSVNSEVLMTEPGRLTIEVFDDRGCYQQNSIDIDVPELGVADFEYNAESIDRTGDLASNDPVSFFDLSEGEVIDWHWDFGDGFDSDEIDPIHTYDAPGTYIVRLVVTDRTGCETEKVSVLEITEGYKVIVPNAFTPNGDGNNDFFRPRMLGLVKSKLIIYNTWGEVIFSTDDIETKGWDGTIKGRKAENGNYVYKIIGLSFNGLKVEREGIFALIN
jgi:gliding motility-associated-like protein